MIYKDYLILIPARGGSKGIPHKNIKQLGGRPLIYYSIDIARQVVVDADICISTDDLEIKKCVEDYGLKVPFVRASCLATDDATTNDVILDALKYYETNGVVYKAIILKKPKKPLRQFNHLKEAIELYYNF
jgi:N-acylneuraminate cytidylyltransferase